MQREPDQTVDILFLEQGRFSLFAIRKEWVSWKTVLTPGSWRFYKLLHGCWVPEIWGSSCYQWMAWMNAKSASLIEQENILDFHWPTFNNIFFLCKFYGPSMVQFDQVVRFDCSQQFISWPWWSLLTTWQGNIFWKFNFLMSHKCSQLDTKDQSERK